MHIQVCSPVSTLRPRSSPILLTFLELSSLSISLYIHTFRSRIIDVWRGRLIAITINQSIVIQMKRIRWLGSWYCQKSVKNLRCLFPRKYSISKPRETSSWRGVVKKSWTKIAPSIATDRGIALSTSHILKSNLSILARSREGRTREEKTENWGRMVRPLSLPYNHTTLFNSLYLSIMRSSFDYWV